ARTAGPGAVAVGRGAADRRASARAPHDSGSDRFFADLPERSAPVAAGPARDQEPRGGMAGAVGAAFLLRLCRRPAGIFRSSHADHVVVGGAYVPGRLDAAAAMDRS